MFASPSGARARGSPGAFGDSLEAAEPSVAGARGFRGYAPGGGGGGAGAYSREAGPGRQFPSYGGYGVYGGYGAYDAGGGAYATAGSVGGYGAYGAYGRGAQAVDEARAAFLTGAPSVAKAGEGFLFDDALSEVSLVGVDEVEGHLAQTTHVEVDQDLYTNVVLSMLSPMDTATTRAFAIALIVIVAALQCILTIAIQTHVSVAMSWTERSVLAKSMHEMYEGLRNSDRLEYIRLEQKDLTDLCGDFQFNLYETPLDGTKWTAYYDYRKVPVNSWKAQDIPPTDRSQLDTTRFVLENSEYMCVYMIVTFIWLLTIINEVRFTTQFMLAVTQMPLAARDDDRLLLQDGEEYKILAFTRAAKLMGMACVFYRLFITVFITVVGCQFLMWTPTNIELILNALALTFVLELDHITYRATISGSRQNLISKLKMFEWHDPSGVSARHPNTAKLILLCAVVGVAGGSTYYLRTTQRYAYYDKFSLVASLCLYQGPTPGYWSQFHSTFPAPGLCETVLGLRCEATLVGDQGRPCVEDWDQKLCKFYVRTNSPYSTWSSIDWREQGPCVAFDGDEGPFPVKSLDVADDQTTYSVLASACQLMYQQQPQLKFQGQARRNTGPRVRVFPYREFVPAAPIWCKYTNGSQKILQPNQPTDFLKWRQALMDCEGTMLNYADRASASGTWLNQEETKMAEREISDVDNMTQAKGIFSGIWLSKEWGVIVISHMGDKAKVTNSNLPGSPVTAYVNGTKIMLPYQHLEGVLEDGKIKFDNGVVCVSQAEELKEREAQKKDIQSTPAPPKPLVFFLR